MFIWLANWWDGVDLWLSQLAFPFQFAIVIAVLGPVCFGLAWAIDRVVDVVSGWLGRTRDTQTVTVVAPEPVLGRADVPAGTPGMIISSEPPETAAARAPEATGS